MTTIRQRLINQTVQNFIDRKQASIRDWRDTPIANIFDHEYLTCKPNIEIDSDIAFKEIDLTARIHPEFKEYWMGITDRSAEMMLSAVLNDSRIKAFVSQNTRYTNWIEENKPVHIVLNRGQVLDLPNAELFSAGTKRFGSK